MTQGTVKRLNAEKGYGFISRTDGPDVFAHYSQIDGSGFRSLEENQHAEFEWPRGRRARRRPASCPSRRTSPRDAVHRHVRVGGGL
jgi:cold shock protein